MSTSHYCVELRDKNFRNCVLPVWAKVQIYPPVFPLETSSLFCNADGIKVHCGYSWRNEEDDGGGLVPFCHFPYLHWQVANKICIRLLIVQRRIMQPRKRGWKGWSGSISVRCGARTVMRSANNFFHKARFNVFALAGRSLHSIRSQDKNRQL